MPDLWLPQGGVNRKQREIWLPQGGVNRRIRELWVGKGGVNRKIFNAQYDIYNAGTIGSCGLTGVKWRNTNAAIQYLSTYVRIDSYGLESYSDAGLITTNPIDVSEYSTLSITFDFKRCSYSNNYAMTLEVRESFISNLDYDSRVLAGFNKSDSELSGLSNPITYDLDISAITGNHYPFVKESYSELWIHRIWLHN
jgi:hypothetical protein